LQVHYLIGKEKADPVEIHYKDSKIRALCTDEKKARRTLGHAGYRKLRARLADLEAASSLGDLPAGRPHPLRGDREGMLAIDLNGGNRIVLEPADDPLPLDREGYLDWKKVRSVRIVFIGDYHDD